VIEVNRADWAEKLILMIMAGALVSMLISSFVFKWQHPSFFVINKNQQKNQATEPMAIIGSLMQKLKKNPQDVETIRKLAQVFMAMESWDRAIHFWQKLLDLKNKDPRARQNLAMSYFHLQQYEAAARELEIVLQLETGNFYAHYNLGVLYGHYLNSPQKAKKHFQFIVQSDQAPDNLRGQAKKQLSQNNS